MIVARNLCKSFGETQVLRDVSLSLAGGDFAVLVGASGVGKSTLLRILAGLDRPDSGSVEVDHELATGPKHCLSPHMRSIGFVFQSPTLWPHMSVLGNVAFAVAQGGRQARQDRARAVLEEVGAAGLAGRYPGQISQGQAHRVALARALAGEPRHLFLDEPFANLDEDTRPQLMALVKRRASQAGVAVLLVTHDRAERAQSGGRILRLQDGCLSEEGAKKGDVA